MSDNISVDVKIKRLTDKAYFVATKDKKNKAVEIWVPKSQVVETDCLAEGDEGYLILKPWFAEQANLIEKKENA
jgi:hypothetical protein